jgi:ABC-type sugar transport system ATPase subunit
MIGRKLESVFPEKRRQRGDEVLRVEGLCVGDVLHDINLELHRGEVLAIAGLSGSGKADLGKAIYGALPFESGRIFVGGLRYYDNTPRRSIRDRMIFLPEDRKADGVLQELSIRRNLSLSVLRGRVANRFGVLSREAEQAVAQEQVDALEIKTPSIEENVYHLSGGNQQKVALGRCLAVHPEIFILMEPTQGIDVGVKFEIYQFIVEQVAQEKAILLISSELAEILGLAHRVLVMHEGRIVADLDADQTSQEEILQYALGEN